jgi:6-phosphofructokinase
MNLRILEWLLRLYPPAHREIFGEEMASVLRQAAEDRRAEGWLSYVRFFVCEVTGLAAGAVALWAARFAGQERTLVEPQPAGLSKIQETERKIQTSIDCMVHAIANHQFEKARFYSIAERKFRARLEELRNRYGISG